MVLQSVSMADSICLIYDNKFLMILVSPLVSKTCSALASSSIG